MIDKGFGSSLGETGDSAPRWELGPIFEEDFLKVEGECCPKVTIDRRKGDDLGGVRG